MDVNAINPILTAFTTILPQIGFQQIEKVVAPKGTDLALLDAISALRTQGFRVIQLLGNDDLSSVPYATHQLVNVAGEWTVTQI